MNGLNHAIKKDIQDSQNTFTDLLRMRGESKLLESQVDSNNKAFDQKLAKNEDMTLKLTTYHSKYDGVTLEGDSSVLNKLISKDNKSDTLIEVLSETKSQEEINGFFIEQYIEGSIGLNFPDMLTVLEKRFKNEFTAKCQLRDLMSQ